MTRRVRSAETIPQPRRDAWGDRRHARAALAIARVSLASYFLLSAGGLVSDPVIRMLFSGYALSDQAFDLLRGSVLMASSLVLFGVAVRPAALYLAVFLLWSAGLQAHGGVLTDERSAAMVGALALFAGMVLVAIQATPFAPRPATPRPATPRPAATRPALAPAHGRGMAEPAGGLSGAPVSPRRITRRAETASDAAEPPARKPRPRPLALARVEADDGDNIFADLWDEGHATG